MRMERNSKKVNSVLKKMLSVLVMCMTLCIIMHTGIMVGAAQLIKENTNYLRIGKWRSVEANHIEFDASVKTLGSKSIEIYRSEKPVSEGGTLKKLDSFVVYGGWWQNIENDRYAQPGDENKVICYSSAPKASGELTFRDTTVKVGHQYSYQIKYSDYVLDPDTFVDDVKIVSNTITVKVGLQAPEIYKCYSSDGKTVNLSWSMVNQADGYKLYRYDNGKWFYLKGTKKGTSVSVTDKNVKSGKTYQYRVLAYTNVNGKNIYSPKSAVRKVTLKAPTVTGDYKYGSIYGPSLNSTQLSQVRSVVQSFKTNYIRKGMSDYDKVLTAFNYLRNNCSYAYKGWQYNYANTAWGALIYGEAQCSGYARGMKALCDGIGVDCRYVHANAKASNPEHQWNQVKVGGKWYILDAQAGFFLIGSETWKKQAGMAWDTKGLPVCSKTDYKLG